MLILNIMELKQYRKSLFRKIYHFFIILIMLIGLVQLLDKKYYLAVVWIFVTPILLLVPRNIYKIKSIKNKYNAKVLFLMEAFSLIFLIDGASGTLYLYPLGIDYDSFVHFINFLLITILVALFYTFFNNKNNLSNKEVSRFAFLSTFVVGVLFWEPFQKLNDILFGTQLFHDFVQDTKLDTLLDLGFGAIGTLVGAFLIYKYWDSWVKKWKK